MHVSPQISVWYYDNHNYYCFLVYMYVLVCIYVYCYCYFGDMSRIDNFWPYRTIEDSKLPGTVSVRSFLFRIGRLVKSWGRCGREEQIILYNVPIVFVVTFGESHISPLKSWSAALFLKSWVLRLNVKELDVMSHLMMRR